MTRLLDVSPDTMSDHIEPLPLEPDRTTVLPSVSAPDLAGTLTDSEDEAVEELTQEQKAADRRRTQNAKFESWYALSLGYVFAFGTILTNIRLGCQTERRN